MLAGYSALNFGHLHPTLVGAARAQLERLTLTSRAFHSDRLGPFCRDLATLADKDLVLPMNTGAEAVETAIKTVRRWGYEVKGVPDGRARIVVMAGNFHGRTTTIISFSDDPVAHDHYGPYTPGFDTVPFGDIEALEAAITDDTVAVLLEPIQGEGGVILPPDGWLRDVRELTRRRNVLMVADEIQSGLGRTGTTFACDVEGVVPDVYVLGKALGGGIVPVSAVVANRDVLGVFTPGSHGSTFGGNPLAAAVGQAVVGLLATGEFQQRARRLGALLESGLRELLGHGVVGGALPRTLGRRRLRPPAADRTRGVAPPARARRPRQGHARLDGAHRSPARHQRDGDPALPRRLRRDPALTDRGRGLGQMPRDLQGGVMAKKKKKWSDLTSGQRAWIVVSGLRAGVPRGSRVGRSGAPPGGGGRGQQGEVGGDHRDQLRRAARLLRAWAPGHGGAAVRSAVLIPAVLTPAIPRRSARSRMPRSIFWLISELAAATGSTSSGDHRWL